MEMSADEIDRLFEAYEFRDLLDHTLTRNVVFQELLKLAVEGSDCLIEEAKIEGKSSCAGGVTPLSLASLISSSLAFDWSSPIFFANCLTSGLCAF